MDNKLSTAVEDYLKAIHRLGGVLAPVPTAEIALLLNVKPPSVTGMLRRLNESAWIEYSPGSGAKLTEAGVVQARRVIRRHRLIELFLTQVLGLDWSEVDAEAEALEHAISPRLEEAIAAYLGEPLEDPHGHPIPSADGALANRNFQRLDQFQPGDQVLIREAQDDDPKRLKRWHELGLRPGVVVVFLQKHPLDDVYELQIDNQRIQLGREGLAGLRGELIPSPQESDQECTSFGQANR